ncbi:hypothetical protein [Lysobacter gummosus]|uniref:hypothetical protein n=1 Tax=Lysobacter gummosus TaxID=262324 RepID=UPI0007222E62|nr:hypothetical protein LG3211_3830 [Lysobacter gummosus]
MIAVRAGSHVVETPSKRRRAAKWNVLPANPGVASSPENAAMDADDAAKPGSKLTVRKNPRQGVLGKLMRLQAACRHTSTH